MNRLASAIIGLAAAMLAAGGLAGGAAQAAGFTQGATNDFTACDGFAAPDGSGDGMTTYAYWGGLLKGTGITSVKSPAASGAAGVGACSGALEDPRLKPEYWLRKVNLLKARAVHNLERGQVPAALADIGRARAAATAPDDPFYRRSLAVDLDIIEGHALRKADRTAEGDALLHRAMSERPWARLTLFGALNAMGPGRIDAEALGVSRDLARLHPMMLNELFVDAARRGDWKEVVALYPQQIGPAVFTIDDYGYRVDNPIPPERFAAERAGITAFALMTLGRKGEAEALIAQARARVAAKTVDPPPPPPLPTANMSNSRSFRYKPPAPEDIRRAKEAQQAYQQTLALHRRIRAQAGGALDLWEGEMKRYAAAEAAAPAEALRGFIAEPLHKGSTGVAIIDAALARSPDPATRASLTQLRGLLDTPPPPSATDLGRFISELHDPEVVQEVDIFRKKGLNPGFSVKPTRKNDPNALTIKYWSNEAPSSIVEEVVLLKAAQEARSRGRKAFVIVARADIEHTTISTYYGSVTGSRPSGYSVDLDVVLTDPGDPAWRDTPWRLIDAEAVWTALAPVYLAPQ